MWVTFPVTMIQSLSTDAAVTTKGVTDDEVLSPKYIVTPALVKGMPTK
jgi:hypothetical protein